MLRVTSNVAERPEGADLDRLGWYAPKGHELVIQLDVPASVDHGLLAMVEAELQRGLGAPAAPWFSRGVASALLGSAGGLKLTQIESRTQEVTPSDVFDGLGRPSMTLAPAEARLARCLMVELGASVADAWGQVQPGASAPDERIEAAWQNSLEISGISPQLVYPRSVRSGKYVALGAPLVGLGTKELEVELRRISSLGACGIEIPVAMNLPTDATDAQGRQGASIMGGAAPLVSTALFARGLGLSVVLNLRFTTAPSAAEWEDPEAVKAYGLRRGIAVEALSWIAEFAQVDGIVLFGRADLCAPAEVDITPELRAARRSMRRESLVSSRPFAGDRLAFVRDEEEALWNSAQGEDFSAEFHGALAVINLKVGLGGEIPRLGYERAGLWSLPGAYESAGNLRDLADEALKARLAPDSGQ